MKVPSNKVEGFQMSFFDLSQASEKHLQKTVKFGIFPELAPFMIVLKNLEKI